MAKPSRTASSGEATAPCGHADGEERVRCRLADGFQIVIGLAGQDDDVAGDRRGCLDRRVDMQLQPLLAALGALQVVGRQPSRHR
jgi:hypothetical protein